MNILDAWLKQYNFFNIIFSSVDLKLLTKIVKNLSKDFGAKVFDISEDIINVDSPNYDNIKKKICTKDKIKFIIAPYLQDSLNPFEKSYHINISLNKTLKIEKKIPIEIVLSNSKYSQTYRVNKYYNLNKFENDGILEDDIFNHLIKYIQKGQMNTGCTVGIVR